MLKQVFKKEFNGRTLIVETGEVAKQANGSVIVKMNESIVLSTVCAAKNPKDVDFFPLTVTFEEKLYSVGKIPGSFLRREGRPSEHATLTARMIDRPIRPLFAEGFRNEVQIVNTVLSVDPEVPVEMLAMFGASLALSISDIPFNGPIAGVTVGLIEGELVFNPSAEQLLKSKMQLEVAGTKKAINMVEADAKELSEEVILDAIMKGHEEIKKLIAFQEEIVNLVGKEKLAIALYEIEPKIADEVNKLAKDRLIESVKINEKLKRYNAIDEINEEIVALFEARQYANEKEKNNVIKQVKDVLHDIVKAEVRRLITVEKIRPDGRKIDEIRPLNSQVDLLPRVHGSALFTRGETQVLSIVTLGALGDSQILDNLSEGDALKRFMHHYNFPPFSVGEVGRMGNPGRREIGHGYLGERALAQVIPNEQEFPYTIRVVSEVLESNGSSSQGSICASSMALMCAGVPIKAPLSGIAMGLVTNGPLEDNAPYTILTDIQGMEDHLGDMDFKVAGSAKGICALQMDIKISGINEEILRKALAQAKEGRAKILDNMNATIAQTRDQLSKYAPKAITITIPVDKIREVIGPGGKMINEIIEKSNNPKIDIEQDGRVTIYHIDMDAINTAVKLISNLTRTAKVGEIYKGKVVRIDNFSIFVNLFGDVDGRCRIGEICDKHIAHPKDVVKMDEEITVIVTNIDEKGRVEVSRRQAMAQNIDIKK